MSRDAVGGPILVWPGYARNGLSQRRLWVGKAEEGITMGLAAIILDTGTTRRATADWAITTVVDTTKA